MNQITIFGVMFVLLSSLTYLCIHFNLKTPENMFPNSLLSKEQRERIRQHEARAREGMEKGGLKYHIFQNFVLGVVFFIGLVMIFIGIVINPRPLQATKPPVAAGQA
ncbi:MAG: hypothetical protein U0903_11825, partial [Planctomycetales bacterium]